MKKSFTFITPTILLCLILSGCAIFGTGKNIAKEEKSRAKIENVNSQISSNAMEKLDTIAGLSYGVNYSLRKVTDPSREVSVAMDLNQRVISLSGSPSVEAMKEMQSTIDKLTSTLEKERKQGQKMLDEKDKQITETQNETKALLAQKDAAIQRYMKDAKDAAANADAYKQELADYEGWFGLKAVVKGSWRFIKSAAWILSIGSILFLVLRFASLSNPAAASIFAIFDTIASWFIHAFSALFPKALQLAGNVSSSLFNTYKSTLTKLVDAIQLAKEKSDAVGKQPNLEDVLDEVAKSMDDDEKAIIIELKKALHWK